MNSASERLQPFFQPVPMRYTHFRHPLWGAVWLVGLPLLLGLALVLTLLILLVEESTFALLLGVAAVVVSLALARKYGRRRLEAALSEFIAFVEVHGRSLPPHLIGHSLGTLLCGAALERTSIPRLKRVIYCAAVLPRNYKWKPLVDRTPPRVEAVRNEVGLRDWVPVLATLLGGVDRRFGSAGRHGFTPEVGLVHTVADATHPCDLCRSDGLAPVHNVMFPYKHSDYFEGGSECDERWIPFLLGYEPAEYLEITALCVAATSFGESNPKLVSQIEVELKERFWIWANGTLEQRLYERIHARLAKPLRGTAEIVARVDFAAGRFWRHVGLAQLERSKGPTNENPELVLALSPIVAFERAVADALDV